MGSIIVQLLNTFIMYFGYLWEDFQKYFSQDLMLKNKILKKNFHKFGGFEKIYQCITRDIHVYMSLVLPQDQMLRLYPVLAAFLDFQWKKVLSSGVPSQEHSL